MSAPSPPSSPRFVKCPGCGARLKVRAEDAGKRAQCHECGKLFRLGGAPAPASPLPSAAMPRQEPRSPEPTPPTPQPINVLDNAHLHPVHCELCQTLMYATDAEVGTMVKCPDCGHRNLAKRREAKRPAPQVLVPDGDEYQLDETHVPPPTPAYMSIEAREAEGRAAARARAGIRQPEPDLLDDEPPANSNQPPAPRTQPARTNRPVSAPSQSATQPSERRRTRPTGNSQRPLIPVVQGVLRMIFTTEVLGRWVGLSLVLTGTMYAIGFVVNAMGAMVLMALWVFAGGCVLAGMWVVSAAPLLMSIVTQTSSGSDELHDPPNWLDFEFAEAGFFVLAVASSGVPAWLASKGAQALPLEAQAAVGFGLWLIAFPFVVLSALEQGSAFALVSPRIVASLFRCFIPWLAFTAVTVLWSVAAGGVIAFFLTRGSLLALLPIPWIVVAWLLVYARLIGRLGWWIADVMPPPSEVEGE